MVREEIEAGEGDEGGDLYRACLVNGARKVLYPPGINPASVECRAAE